MLVKPVSNDGKPTDIRGEIDPAEGSATKIIQAGKHDAVEVPVRTGAGGGGSGGGSPGELTSSPMSRDESEQRWEFNRMESPNPRRPR